MVDAWLIVITVVTAVLMLGVTIYIFYLYCHPDDNAYVLGWVAKVVVIAAFSAVWGFILLLPLDVANSRGAGGYLNMDLAYQILFLAAFCLLAFLLPFTLFLYETDEDRPLVARLCWASAYEAGVAVAVGCFALLAWGALRRADVADLQHATLANLALSEAAGAAGAATSIPNGVGYALPPYLFACVFLLFLGWFLFALLGAIGTVALPFDLVMGYVYRPKPRTALEMAEKKVALRRRCEELIAFARVLEGAALEGAAAGGALKRWRADAKLHAKEGKLRRELFLLEQEVEIYELEAHLKANPLWDIAKLALGVVLAAVSCLLVLHLLLYRLIVIGGRPASLFLNALLLWVEDKIAGFVATVLFAGLGFYLVFCVIKGTLAFGLRLFFVVKVHPMQLNKTYMNSFLFNAALVLLAALGSVHFTALLFAHYMRLTAGAALFGTLLARVRGLKLFWQHQVFLYAYLVVVLLSAAVLMLRPQADKLDVRAMIRKRKKN